MKPQKAIVVSVIKRAEYVRSLRFLSEQQLPFKAGQFLRLEIGENKLKRYLSISNAPTETGYLEVTKKLTGSDFSKALDGLKSGDTVFIEYPMGSFILDEKPLKIAFLSGGIGITPIRSMIKYATDKKLDFNIALLYVNKTVDDIVFRQDFEDMQAANPQFKLVNVLSEPAGSIDCKIGRIDSHIIEEAIPDFAERRFYICGPPEMVSAMKNILLNELHMPTEAVVTENFQGY